jgi:predicted tellurium resistance membrane protein TerC
MSPHEIAEFTGWLNVFLLVMLSTTGIFLKFLSQKGTVKKSVFKFHPFIGIALIVSVITHGYYMMGGIYMHTGTVLGAVIIFGYIIYFILRAFKSKHAHWFHRFVPIPAVILMVIHLVFPALFS